MPITVQSDVSSHDRPNVAPVSGPPINFIVLAIMTEIYLAKCIMNVSWNNEFKVIVVREYAIT
ncbi:hypothetical protein GCM10028806_48520 [Spirosoma terrae]